MQRYIHNIIDFFELFEKLKFSMEKYDTVYSAVLFELKDETRVNEFISFLLKYLRISDTVFSYRNSKLLVILEDTTLMGALRLNNDIRNKIEEKGFNFDYWCSSVQGNFIDSDEKLLKSLNKRIEIAKKEKLKECVYDLSEY